MEGFLNPQSQILQVSSRVGGVERGEEGLVVRFISGGKIYEGVLSEEGGR